MESENPFAIGDQVYVRSDGKCDSEWSGPKRVTAIKSPVSLELNCDGVTRHITDVKRVPRSVRMDVDASQNEDDSDSDSAASENFVFDRADFQSGDLSSGSDSDDLVHTGLEPETNTTPVAVSFSPRRSTRFRRPPAYLQDYVT